MQLDYDAEVTFQARAPDLRLRARPQPRAVLPRRLVQPSARPLGDPRGATGSATTPTRSPPPAFRRYRPRRPTPTAAAAGDDRRRRGRALGGAGANRAPRLLRRDQLRGRAHRRAARRAARRRPRRRHGRRVHGRSRRDAGRTGALVQDVVLRALGARAVDRVRRRAGSPRGGWPSRCRCWTSRRRCSSSPAIPAEELAAELDGASLAPLLDGRAAAGPRDVVAEYLAEGVTSPAVMIRRGTHKFVRCGGDPDQLYDLAHDPHELVNLAERSENADLRRSFARRWPRAGTWRTSSGGSSRASASATWWRRRLRPAPHFLGLPAPCRRRHPVRAKRRGPVRGPAAGSSRQRRPALSRRPDSNRRHPLYERGALPTELRRRCGDEFSPARLLLRVWRSLLLDRSGPGFAGLRCAGGLGRRCSSLAAARSTPSACASLSISSGSTGDGRVLGLRSARPAQSRPKPTRCRSRA